MSVKRCCHGTETARFVHPCSGSECMLNGRCFADAMSGHTHTDTQVRTTSQADVSGAISHGQYVVKNNV